MKDCMVHVVHVPSFNRVERFILRVLLTVEDQGGVFPSVSIVYQVESAYSVVWLKQPWRSFWLRGLHHLPLVFALRFKLTSSANSLQTNRDNFMHIWQ